MHVFESAAAARQPGSICLTAVFAKIVGKTHNLIQGLIIGSVHFFQREQYSVMGGKGAPSLPPLVHIKCDRIQSCHPPARRVVCFVSVACMRMAACVSLKPNRAFRPELSATIRRPSLPSFQSPFHFMMGSPSPPPPHIFTRTAACRVAQDENAE